MTWRAICREAWRNVISHTTKAGILAIVFALFSLGLATTDALATRQLLADATTYRTVGASIMTIEAQGRIDGPACNALATIPGVRASGAVRTTRENLTTAVLPSAPIPVFETTAGFLDVMGTGGTSGVVLSADALDAVSRNVGDELSLRDGRSVTITGSYVYPSDGRSPGFGYAALLPAAPIEPFDQCWVDVWPVSPQTRSLLSTTVNPDSSAQAENPTVSQLNTTLGTGFDGNARFAMRITRFAPALAAGLALVLGFVAVRRRRVELSSSMHAGATRAALGLMLFLETLAWVLPALVLTPLVLHLLGSGLPTGDAAALLTTSMRTVALAACSAYLGVCAGLLFTREKQLFAYFKDR